MHGEQRLVGGDHRLARGDRRLDQRAGRTVGAADQLHHHVDRGVGGQRHRVLVPAQAGQRHAAVARAVAGRDGGDRDRPSGAGGDDVGVVAQQLQHAAADRAEAGDRRRVERHRGHWRRPSSRSGFGSLGLGTAVVGLQETRGCCASPGAAGACSPPARCARSPRRARRSRGPAPPPPWPRASSSLENSTLPRCGEARRDRRPGEHRAIRGWARPSRPRPGPGSARRGARDTARGSGRRNPAGRSAPPPPPPGSA